MLDFISKLTNGKTRLITAENVYGKKEAGGKAVPGGTYYEDVALIGQNPCTDSPHPARDLGIGWKVRPYIILPKSSVTTILDADYSGTITHIWMTFDRQMTRDLIIRMYWDGEKTPSVESPVGDFFGAPFKENICINAIPLNINPKNGCNCFFPMPFRKGARITVENRNPETDIHLFYAISLDERSVADNEAYFHAQYRRQNPTDGKNDYVILDNVKGKGHYVGTVLGWQQNNDGWWGEGEVKMYIDGDKDYPTYIGTGTEDYFGGAWGFFDNYSAPFLGYCDMTAANEGSKTNHVGNRHAMYRFHIPDPIRFETDLKVTIQAIGWRSEGRFLPLKDDVCSVAYWYQTEPHSDFKPFPSRDETEVI